MVFKQHAKAEVWRRKNRPGSEGHTMLFVRYFTRATICDMERAVAGEAWKAGHRGAIEIRIYTHGFEHPNTRVNIYLGKNSPSLYC